MCPNKDLLLGANEQIQTITEDIFREGTVKKNTLNILHYDSFEDILYPKHTGNKADIFYVSNQKSEPH